MAPSAIEWWHLNILQSPGHPWQTRQKPRNTRTKENSHLHSPSDLTDLNDPTLFCQPDLKPLISSWCIFVPAVLDFSINICHNCCILGLPKFFGVKSADPHVKIWVKRWVLSEQNWWALLTNFERLRSISYHVTRTPKLAIWLFRLFWKSWPNFDVGIGTFYPEKFR